MSPLIHDLTTPFEPLVRRIEREATVIEDRILRIDHFLNHRIEPGFISDLGHALARRISAFQPSLILTAEASGIAPALVVSQTLNVPMLYAKKYSPSVEPPALSRLIPSPTKGGEIRLVLSQRFLPAGCRVALVDDFLANGRTAVALVEMVREAGAQVMAAGFIVSKSYMRGPTLLADLGVPVASLAQVEDLENGRAILRQPHA